jgi:hypothetical protein
MVIAIDKESSEVSVGLLVQYGNKKSGSCDVTRNA